MLPASAPGISRQKIISSAIHCFHIFMGKLPPYGKFRRIRSYYSGLVGKMQSIADFSRKLLHLCRRVEHAAQEADTFQQGLFAFDKLRVRFKNHRAVEAILAQDARKLLPVKHAAPRQT